MKTPLNKLALALNASAIKKTIERALHAAGINTASGLGAQVTATVERALAGNRSAPKSAQPIAARAPVIDVSGTVVDEGAHASEHAHVDAQTNRARAWPDAPADPPAATPAQFERHRFSNPAGTREYKLYLPAQGLNASSGHPHQALRPVVVMLHGCTQSADDFAAGTQMNRLADEHGCIVLYPEQTAQANPAKCWNWFNPQDQLRDSGEPAVIAGMVQEVLARHGGDPQRVFVAGLSAGAAMAVVLGETHPELFAGVGVHSGLPYASAHDVASAMAAMKGGRSGMPSLRGLSASGAGRRGKAVQAVPTIVFHGDRDSTVQHSNGEAIVEQVLQARSQSGDTAMEASSSTAQSEAGRRFTRTVHQDSRGHSHLESWTVHGAGHAWSGGHPDGSYTDSQGPDASREMLRFFLALPH